MVVGVVILSEYKIIIMLMFLCSTSKSGSCVELLSAVLVTTVGRKGAVQYILGWGE